VKKKNKIKGKNKINRATIIYNILTYLYANIFAMIPNKQKNKKRKKYLNEK
jgi:hypothetical protein